MPTCPYCLQSVVTCDGHDRHGRQRFACASCGRDFTVRSVSACSGYRWPADLILMAVRRYLRHPLSATSVMALLAERGIDVSNRTVLRWVQAFGPTLKHNFRWSAPDVRSPATAGIDGASSRGSGQSLVAPVVSVWDDSLDSRRVTRQLVGDNHPRFDAILRVKHTM